VNVTRSVSAANLPVSCHCAFSSAFSVSSAIAITGSRTASLAGIQLFYIILMMYSV
jgi:hypothetical protein